MNVIKSFSIYTFASFIDRGIGFFLLPVFTYYLSPEEFGQLELILTFVAVISPFILLQLKGAVSVEYFRLDKIDFNSYLKSALVNPFFSFFIFFFIFFILRNFISNWISISPFWVLMIPVLSFIKLFPELIRVLFQVKENPISFSMFSVSYSVGELLLSLLLVAGFLLGVQGRLFGALLAGGVFSIIGLYLLYIQGVFKGGYQNEHRVNAFQFGYKLIPHVIGAWVINASDRIFISQMVSNSELGIYSVGYKIGSIIMVIEMAAAQAWMPFLFKQIKEDSEKSKKNIVLMGYGFATLLVFSLIVLIFFSPLLYKFNILSDEYIGGVNYVFWVGLGYVFLGFYKIFTGFIFFFKKTKLLSIVSVFNVIVNLVLNYLLIKEYGAIGAAYATAISFLLFFILVAYIGNKIYPLQWLKPFKILKWMSLK